MNNLILAINPGSTSTKLALFQEDEKLFSATVDHTKEELAQFPTVSAQYEMRLALIRRELAEHSVEPGQLAAVVGRGGLLPPNEGGAYLVNDAMLRRLRECPLVEHASNLGAILADAMARPLGIPAYIYDPVTTDELDDIARLSGIPQLRRVSTLHALNSRAVAIQTAQSLGKSYESSRFIVAHLGGGVSYSAHRDGRIVDLVLDDEGSFSVERSGGLPAYDLVELCFSGRYDRAAMKRLIRGEGGLKAYLGLTDAREVERRIAAGDKQAELCYSALAYQAAKSIAQLSVVFCGKLDAIILTGGLAYSTLLTGQIMERVSFLAPVVLKPGEAELEALAAGALRVLSGKETAKSYAERVSEREEKRMWQG